MVQSCFSQYQVHTFSHRTAVILFASFGSGNRVSFELRDVVCMPSQLIRSNGKTEHELKQEDTQKHTLSATHETKWHFKIRVAWPKKLRKTTRSHESGFLRPPCEFRSVCPSTLCRFSFGKCVLCVAPVESEDAVNDVSKLQGTERRNACGKEPCCQTVCDFLVLHQHALGNMETSAFTCTQKDSIVHCHLRFLAKRGFRLQFSPCRTDSPLTSPSLSDWQKANLRNYAGQFRLGQILTDFRRTLLKLAKIHGES